ncbi:MAG: hypothetical protein RI897_821 [Verrucomicrobiota bacterium]
MGGGEGEKLGDAGGGDLDLGDRGFGGGAQVEGVIGGGPGDGGEVIGVGFYGDGHLGVVGEVGDGESGVGGVGDVGDEGG